jgi:hypothetical protein
MSRNRAKGKSEQEIKDEQLKKEKNKAKRLEKKAKAQGASLEDDSYGENCNSQEKIEMTRTDEDPWEGRLTDKTGKQPLTSRGNSEFIAQGRDRREKTYPALSPAKETIDVTPTQSKKTGVITDQEMKDYVANANPQNMNDVMKMSAAFLASQDPERVIATAKAAMAEPKAKKPKQTGSLISRITSFCCLYLGHLAALIFLAFISGSTDMIRLMLTAPFLILLFIGELILCKRLTTNNE